MLNVSEGILAVRFEAIFGTIEPVTAAGKAISLMLELPMVQKAVIGDLYKNRDVKHLPACK